MTVELEQELAAIDPRIAEADRAYIAALASANAAKTLEDINHLFNVADIKMNALMNLINRKRLLETGGPRTQPKVVTRRSQRSSSRGSIARKDCVAPIRSLRKLLQAVAKASTDEARIAALETLVQAATEVLGRVRTMG